MKIAETPIASHDVTVRVTFFASPRIMASKPTRQHVQRRSPGTAAESAPWRPGCAAPLPAAGLRGTLPGTARRSTDGFLIVSMRRVSRTLIDPAFSQARKLLVCSLFFIECLLQELGGLGVTHRLRPRD